MNKVTSESGGGSAAHFPHIPVGWRTNIKVVLIWVATMRAYYHRTTFLQLNTFWFLLHFPNPLILSELPGSGRNDSKFMFEFLFEDILPIIRCNSMQKVLDWPFCNLWQHAEPPNSKSDNSLPKNVASRSVETETKTRFARLWSGEWKFLWRQRVMLLHPRRSSSSDNFALMSLGTHI